MNNYLRDTRRNLRGRGVGGAQGVGERGGGGVGPDTNCPSDADVQDVSRAWVGAYEIPTSPPSIGP